MNEFLEKPLPSSEEAEVSVLGSIILDGKMFDIANKTLEPSDFYSAYNRRVFAAMQSLASEDKSITPITITEVWKSEGVDPNSVGGVARVSELMLGLPFYGRKEIEDYTRLVKEHSIARQLIRTCNAAIEDILQGTEPVGKILERSEAKVLTLSTKMNSEAGKSERPFSDLREIVPDVRKQLEDYHMGITNGVPTGMKEVDNMLDGGGLQGGGLYVLAAGEKSGKTSLALDWAYHIAAIQKFGKVLIVTGEMSKVNMAKRIYAAHTTIPYFKFRPGIYDTPSDPVYTNALKGLPELADISIAISDNLVSVPQITRHVRRQVENGLRSKNPRDRVVFIVIDYLQLIELGEKVQRTEEVEKVSRAFKILAMELNLPILTISSLNRLGLQNNEIPDTFNLRQAGTIGFDAEAVFFLHNPSYVPGQPYTPMEVTPMNLILARQRNGPTGPIPVMFIGPYMHFMTVADYNRRMGARDNDNVLPKSQGQEHQEHQEAMKLW